MRNENESPPAKRQLPKTAAAKRPVPWSPLKYLVLAVGVVVWLFGLAGQLDDSVQLGTYLSISALMVAVAALTG